MKNRRGVTLIALAVTIIVILILAGVTISTLNGSTSITKNAEKARRESELGRVVEKINVKVSENQIKNDLADQVEMLVEDGYILEDGTIDVNTVLDGQTTDYGTGTENNIFIIEGNKVIYIDEKGNRVSEKEVNIDTNDSSFTFSRGGKSFITRWNVSAGDIFELPIAIGYTNDNNFIVDWGDGTPEETIDDRETPLTERPSHTYSQAGEFDIKITGHFNYFTLTIGNFNETKQDQIKKLIKIVSWGEVDAYEYGFSNAINLTEIAIPTKKTFINYNDTGFKYMFSGCTGLKRIPNKLFQYANNAKSFKGTFDSCTSLKTIPENLFEKNTEVESFEATFAYCSGLTEVPSNLFANAEKVISYRKTFTSCENIGVVSENLFDNSPNATNFEKTFYECHNLTNGPKIWERENASQISGTPTPSTYAYCENFNKTGLSNSIINKFF